MRWWWAALEPMTLQTLYMMHLVFEKMFEKRMHKSNAQHKMLLGFALNNAKGIGKAYTFGGKAWWW